MKRGVMKVGSKVKLKGSKLLQIYTIETIEETTCVVKDILTGKNYRFNKEDLILTGCSPMVFITTYGTDWLHNVEKILAGCKIKYQTKLTDRTNIAYEIYIDGRKMKTAKEAYDNFYKSLAG